MQADLLDIGKVAPPRALRLSPALICFLLGVLGVLPLVVLTPPFQVPDESQHFLRAYQLSEFRLNGIARDGAAKAMLPSSLIELVEGFLGTRAILADRPVTAQPIGRTWRAFDRPLDPGRREFVTVEYVAYPPPPYLPQAIAIAAGRWLGMGPLALLYLGRLANALTAVAVLALAVRLMPVGRELMMLFGLLPMAIYEYASVSPDAAVISTAFLFTAVALRAQLRGHWSRGEVALAVVTGLVFCMQKPVYAPLLLAGLPAALVRRRAKDVLLVHVVVIAIVIGAAVAWLRLASTIQSIPQESSVAGQAAFIAAHPLGYIGIMLVSFWRQYLYYKSIVGALGWLTISLPMPAYILPLFGVLFGTLAQPRNGPRLPAAAVVWDMLLITGAGALILTSEYLLWNLAGASFIEGGQGRYFIPLLALVAAGWCSVVRTPLYRRGSLAALLMLTAIILAEFVMTDLTIVRAYHEF